MTNYLIWSNKQDAWRGPGGKAYTQDIWEAGRFSLNDAEARCRIRAWEPHRPPPEVVVEAPETHLPLDTFEEIEAAPELTRRLVHELTRVAMRERSEQPVWPQDRATDITIVGGEP
ncbi:hypothetical protein FHR83_006668 [Actinoplanes campanulatus]|uniref:Uncharacterized protein n=1 Tax=Actinoplanes campanulatus TaxID=113559 RepID=A0A7W5AMU6_9ACTN|nr:hypothetical protein [Actinoplanes campanulatus]MBB3098962.1 hypothetical protein [Actinoplanes campanulatus]GGN39672.1 hypothetical protein GCM10010109_67880 [Actinoplanes campanulatus]